MRGKRMPNWAAGWRKFEFEGRWEAQEEEMRRRRMKEGGKRERERRWVREHRRHFSGPPGRKSGYRHQYAGTYSYDREVIAPLVINDH
jgi:hypothetical protein